MVMVLEKARAHDPHGNPSMVKPVDDEILYSNQLQKMMEQVTVFSIILKHKYKKRRRSQHSTAQWNPLLHIAEVVKKL